MSVDIEQLAREALAQHERATAGPWFFRSDEIGGWGMHRSEKDAENNDRKIFGCCDCGNPEEADGALLQDFRDREHRLASEVLRLRALLSQYEAS